MWERRESSVFRQRVWLDSFVESTVERGREMGGGRGVRERRE